MNDTNYINEKFSVAIMCMCDEGSFKERLRNATVSSLSRLNDEDLTLLDQDKDLEEKFKYVLRWTKHNIQQGEIQKEPNESERSDFIENLFSVFKKTAENF